MNQEGRLLCPICRKEHHDGEPKPEITLIVPCKKCQEAIEANNQEQEHAGRDGSIDLFCRVVGAIRNTPRGKYIDIES